MATIKKCDRCGRARPGKYYRVTLTVTEQAEVPEDEPNPEEIEEIQDCCEGCRKTVTKCVTLKKKPRKTKPKGNDASPRKRKPRKPADNGQAARPVPNGSDAKPDVPPAPEV